MQKTESTENYLERIYMLREEKGNVRSIDIAHALNFSKPSVSNAVKKLAEKGYITVDGDHNLFLTSKGEGIATRIYKRHCDLANLFMALGVSEETAYADACMIEHDISEETYQCLLAHYNSHFKK
ncbi:MAG: metal-dependent transcriptional regulator [Eubacteriaceae bacterium]|nr:metal-dependent transcriptional regulator [Eubacteriaceae bacterium]